MTYRKGARIMGIAALSALSACEKAGTQGSRELRTEKDRVSYSIGMDIGRSFDERNLAASDIDMDKLRQGIQDVLEGAKPALSDSQHHETLVGFQKAMTARSDSLQKAKGDSAMRAAKEFLAKNAKEAGVKTTPSGLQYRVLTEGHGAKPDSASIVSVHYVGTLLDGTEFDSSRKRGEPVKFPVASVIPGWTEALQMMPVGSKWKLYVPPDLGYGAQGAGKQIGPNALLVFEVELLDIVKAESEQGSKAAARKPSR